MKKRRKCTWDWGPAAAAAAIAVSYRMSHKKLVVKKKIKKLPGAQDMYASWALSLASSLVVVIIFMDVGCYSGGAGHSHIICAIKKRWWKKKMKKKKKHTWGLRCVCILSPVPSCSCGCWLLHCWGGGGPVLMVMVVVIVVVYSSSGGVWWSWLMNCQCRESHNHVICWGWAWTTLEKRNSQVIWTLNNHMIMWLVSWTFLSLHNNQNDWW